MGMYDLVRYKTSCPRCGTMIDDWQSKDGPCELKMLEAHEIESMIGECCECKMFIEARITRITAPSIEVAFIVPKKEED